MIYSDKFKNVLQKNTFIGTGNPNSSILIVGKEVATDIENSKNIDLEKQNLNNFNKNCQDWRKNVEYNFCQNDIPLWRLGSKENNPLYAFKGLKIKDIKSAGHTWRKYQKLHNYIFLKKANSLLNFQEDFFITEMSILPSKTTRDAQKKTNFVRQLQIRKETFFKSDFIQNFPVVILACSNYISGEEIENIFSVKFTEQHGTGTQKFWIHLNSDKTKIVIHTRQLSANVSNNLLERIADEIRTSKVLKTC